MPLEATSDSELAVDNEFEIADRRRKSFETTRRSPHRRKSIDLVAAVQGVTSDSTKEQQRIQEQIDLVEQKLQKVIKI